MTGRPTKLTPEIQAEICEILREGNYIEVAAPIVGITRETLFGWIRRGRLEIDRVAENPRLKVRKREAPFVAFFHAVKEAQAASEREDLETIKEASKTQWQAAAWRLERKNFDRWGRKQAVELGGKDGEPIEVKATAVIAQYPINPRDEKGTGAGPEATQAKEGGGSAVPRK
jgi:hypothetical protein